VILISSSRLSDEFRFLEDLPREWPDFFPEAISPTDAISLLEYQASADVESDDLHSLSSWLQRVLASPLACAEGLVAFELSLTVEPYSGVRHRRGYWASHRKESIGFPVAEASSIVGGELYLGGVAQLELSPEGIAASLLHKDDSWRGIVLAPVGLDSNDLLLGTLGSQHVGQIDFWLRYVIPELVLLTFPKNGVVIRLWCEDTVELDIIGPRRVLEGWADRMLADR